MVDNFIKLKPYRKFVDEEYVTKGLPMQRPLFLSYENDPVTYALQYQYLFGSDVMVSVVTDEGATQISVYLPEDKWVHMFTGEEFDGPQWVTLDCPLGVPTAFYRKSSQFVNLFKQLQNSAQCDAASCP